MAVPSSWKEARLAIFPKKGKDARYPEAYRPSSILNVDYEILAMILAARLGSVVGIYTQPDQTGFIKGRNVKVNIRKTLNIINKTQMDNISRILLFLDAEKVFDMIEWPYIFAVLDKMKIGPVFQTGILTEPF